MVRKPKNLSVLFEIINGISNSNSQWLNFVNEYINKYYGPKNEFYKISQYQKTDEFKEKYKKRASIEGENAELKRFHGLSRAKRYGLLSMSLQEKLTAIAVNLKRIAAIASSFYYCFLLKTG